MISLEEFQLSNSSILKKTLHKIPLNQFNCPSKNPSIKKL